MPFIQNYAFTHISSREMDKGRVCPAVASAWAAPRSKPAPCTFVVHPLAVCGPSPLSSMDGACSGQLFHGEQVEGEKNFVLRASFPWRALHFDPVLSIIRVQFVQGTDVFRLEV